ncbi:hypothetical protein C8D79_3380 [Bacteriovorax stolpii]|nr:hypothetical protein C8D79_3380 [Bacteriovorax stolpii]BDT29756.1 hypothetical protein BHI3_32220 [Bacteriovorax sp. HI3]
MIWNKISKLDIIILCLIVMVIAVGVSPQL